MNLLYYLQYYTIPLLIATIIIYGLSGWFLIKKRGIYITGIGIGVIIFLLVLNMRSLNPPFFVFGDKQILKDMIINIESIYSYDQKTGKYKTKIETFLYKGKRKVIKDRDAWFYHIYFSYKDSLIGSIRFENLDLWTFDYINHLYIDQKNDTIFMQHIGRNIYKAKREQYEKEYLLIQDSVSTKGETLDKFFNFYNSPLENYSTFK